MTIDENWTGREPERSEDFRREVNLRHLTPAQENRLSKDYANTSDTTQIDNRRDYPGPRWPWLCG